MAERVVIHTIPVPRGWSVEQSWEAIRRGDRLGELDVLCRCARLADPDLQGWVNVETRDSRFVRVLT